MFSSKAMSILQKASVIIALAASLAAGLKQPLHNWDMIAYVAAAYQLDGLQGKELSSATFESVKEEVDPTAFKRLVETNYRATVFHDPASLEQQLPFYNIKIVYIELMRLLKQTGIAYPAATYLISACFAAASILLLAGLCAHFSVPPLLIPFIAIFSGYFSLARFSTPDALACFFALLTLYLFLKKNRFVYVVVVLLPLIRTDLVILSLLVAASAFAARRTFYALVFGLSALVTYWTINAMTGNYGYLVLFNFTFIGIDPYPREMSLSAHAWDYLKAYLAGAKELLLHPHMVVYIMVFYLLFLNETYKKVRSDLLYLAAISCSYVFLHMALFPHYEDRFFAFPASVMCVALFAIPLQKGASPESASAAPWLIIRPGIFRFFPRPKNTA